MKSKQLLDEIRKAISEINSLSSDDHLRVRDLYIDLAERFRNLQREDFKTQSHFDIYKNVLKVPADIYHLEIKALENRDKYALSENYFQIRMSLSGYTGWLEDDY